MARIRVTTVIHAPPRRVWRQVRDIGSHTDWMADADDIRFLTRRRSGRGATFEVATRVGPFRLADRMEVTEWRSRRALGVRHLGGVTGSGRFRLRRRLQGGTRFSWTEELSFPWWLGSRAGELVATPILRRMWRRNLRCLKERVEADGRR